MSMWFYFWLAWKKTMPVVRRKKHIKWITNMCWKAEKKPEVVSKRYMVYIEIASFFISFIFSCARLQSSDGSISCSNNTATIISCVRMSQVYVAVVVVVIVTCFFFSVLDFCFAVATPVHREIYPSFFDEKPTTVNSTIPVITHTTS